MQFEPVHTTGYNDSEDDSSESETDTLEQASFTAFGHYRLV